MPKKLRWYISLAPETIKQNKDMQIGIAYKNLILVVLGIIKCIFFKLLAIKATEGTNKTNADKAILFLKIMLIKKAIERM